ncbi:MAG: acetyl-CoA carboxylase biotin carboxylase subunit [Acidobacteriota bacterium]
MTTPTLRPITRLLVANRGEIALRIMRACDEMGIDTVAVYSDADADALHVRKASRAVHLGPAAPAESYLAIPRLIEAARSSGADAVHPGYGFLAENASFAAACEGAGLTFVGPTSAVMALMGSKIQARLAMRKAGLSVVPGETPAGQSDDALADSAARIGYPLLVKASAGGGGKGMRVVRRESDLATAVAGARHEAQSAFGDGTLYMERLIDHPRHIEIQVLADAHGHAVHLFERDCSTQRRHQKIIEESPSPAVTPPLRARMGEAAARAALAVGYRNAGTMEFLVDGSGDNAHFYFLEMNTRLQVEHPVTEAVTGVDIVRAQLLVAGGFPLPWAQGELHQRGHAIECRVYAEDPAQGFLPQAGTVELYRPPVRPGVRIDSGIEEGTHVSVHYDPLMAKVIAYAETRALAIERMSAALAEFALLGLATNIPFLLRVLQSPAFAEGRLDTAFLDEEGADLGQHLPLPLAAYAAAAVHAEPTEATARTLPSAPDPWERLGGWRA